MRIKFHVTQKDSHVHLDVYTSMRNDLKSSMGLAASNLCMTVEEWDEFYYAMAGRFGGFVEKDGEYVTFVVVR